MSDARSAILLEDPELGDRLTAERLLAARRDCVARVIAVPAGQWAVGELELRMRYGIGLLVLDGLLTRRVGVEGRFGAELLGTGDVLRPWQNGDADITLPHAGGWSVLRHSRMAVLDGGFTLRLGRYPEVISALFARAVRRSRLLALNMAIVHQPRVDVRLQMLFWHLADRWGTVHHDGVRVPLRLTHEVLAELVAARRPSVTKALGELAAQGAVRWDEDAWVLSGRPPHQLAELGGISMAESALVSSPAELRQAASGWSRARGMCGPGSG